MEIEHTWNNQRQSENRFNPAAMLLGKSLDKRGRSILQQTPTACL
jgi:hypothetical protein